MLVNADFKGLEVVTAAFLSQDKVLCKEIIDGVDIHAENQRSFSLPSRLIAKVFKFRILFGGTEHSFATDPDFSSVHYSVKRWKEVIDNYYSKYSGLKDWHVRLIQEATTTGRVVGPTGRFWLFKPELKKGDYIWPVTTIKNYPIQGTGADLVMIARVSLMRRMKALGLKSLLISSIHDSLCLDCPQEEYVIVGNLVQKVIEDVPQNFQKLFGIEFNLPLTSEVLYGPNMFDMVELKD